MATAGEQIDAEFDIVNVETNSLRDQLLALADRVDALEGGGVEPPPPSEGGHTHEPIPEAMPEALYTIECNPTDYRQKYLQWVDAPPGTHLVLAAGEYRDQATHKVISGTPANPKVIRSDGNALLISSDRDKRSLIKLEPGSEHVQIRNLRFGQAQFHVNAKSDETGTTHHILIADCYFEKSWQGSTFMRGHDFTWRKCKWLDNQQQTIDGARNWGWSWCAGAAHYMGTDGEWKLPAALSFIGCDLEHSGGEGLIGSRSTSFLARGNRVWNCLTVGIYWQNCINATIENNIVGADKVMAFDAWPNSRPMAIAGAVEAWDAEVPTRATTNIIIRGNTIIAGNGLLKHAVRWTSRARDNGPHNTYGGLRIEDNNVEGTFQKVPVSIDKLEPDIDRPGPRNVLIHLGDYEIGDPEYWDIS